ncbi:unnamed protein product [Symbiodinium microadriaticum]|nr:unnamed protein product [Symbiodinium microadriaticum]
MPATAREQYRVTNPILTDDGHVLCASWWASYTRLQPGSASSTQSVEAYHASGGRTALVATLDKQAASRNRPAELRRLAPLPFFQALQEAVTAIGQQVLKRPPHSLIDLPDREDPVVRSDSRLALVGRSIAAELFKRRDQIRAVSLAPDSTAFVLRRSLLRWDPDETLPAKGTYHALLLAENAIAVADAQDCARMATETDGHALMQVWQRRKIVSGRVTSTYALNLQQCMHFRYDIVVVLSGAAASSLWSIPLHRCLCPCLPFALGATCEHARVVTSIIANDRSLEVVAETRVGRPLSVSYSASRGATSGQLFQAARSAEHTRASQAALASQRSPFPPTISESSATCLRSDEAARRVPPILNESPEPSAASRGPTEYRTDFAKVQAIMGDHTLPPQVNIYKNERNQAWVAMHAGKTIRGSHASLNLHGTDEAAIAHAWARVQATFPGQMICYWDARTNLPAGYW